MVIDSAGGFAARILLKKDYLAIVREKLWLGFVDLFPVQILEEAVQAEHKR
jgi:hypothetical protein